MAARWGIDWDAQPLGEESDTAIAERLGVNPTAVYQARMRRGIVSCPRRGSHGIDWDLELLGVEPDREIAERYGIPVSTVKAARTRRKIPPPPSAKPGTPETRREVVQLRKRGWTHQDIADVYGVSDTSVLRWLRKEGLR